MRSFFLPDQSATERLAQTMQQFLTAGDVILLDGPVGVGKSAFARALIQSAMRKDGAVEPVPSPTFTLVQVYETSSGTYWHADLYRLSYVEELAELGLDEAFEDAITVIEWPERLGQSCPDRNLTLLFIHEAAEDARSVRLLPVGGGWDWIDSMPDPRITT